MARGIIAVNCGQFGYVPNGRCIPVQHRGICLSLAGSENGNFLGALRLFLALGVVMCSSVAMVAEATSGEQGVRRASLGEIPEDQFDLQVRGLEERVTDLKERIFQTKARLLLLQETVIGGDLSSGARAVIIHKNDMGASFVLESITYILDGVPIFTRVDQSGELNRQKEIEVFNGRIVPGTHQLGVRVVYRGSGFGVFSYLNDYRFRVQSSYAFNAQGGRVTKITVVGYEKGRFTTELEDRPGIRYEEEVTREVPGTSSETVQPEEG